MLYSITDKLDFENNPQIEIKGKKITVNADAKTILKILAVTKGKDDAEATLEAIDLLFSKKDREIIDSFKLSMKDYLTLVSTAVALAMGEDPDKKTQD